MIINKEKITQKELLTYKVGETREYQLPSPDACNSASVTADHMKVKGMTFNRHCPIDKKLKGIIAITRMS